MITLFGIILIIWPRMPTTRALNAPEYDTGNLLDALMILLGAALLYTSNSLKILVFIRSFNNSISRHCIAAVQAGLGWAVSRGCKYRAGLSWAGLGWPRRLAITANEEVFLSCSRWRGGDPPH